MQVGEGIRRASPPRVQTTAQLLYDVAMQPSETREATVDLLQSGAAVHATLNPQPQRPVTSNPLRNQMGPIGQARDRVLF